MKVKDAMARTISTAAKGEPLMDVARKMKKDDAGFIPVVDGGRLLGVVTDRDIVIRCVAEGHDVKTETVEHVLTTGVKTIAPEDDLDTAAQTMATSQVRRLPVVEDGKLVGILSHGNLVQAESGKGPAQKATVGVTRGA